MISSTAPHNPLFYFDFASPNAYLAYKVLPEIEARHGVRFKQVPILLGGLFKLSGNQAPMVAYANVPKKLAYEHKEMQRFIQKHGLSAFRFNPHFPVNTLALMRGAAVAEQEDILAPYTDAMFHFMWEDPRKLDDPEILRQTMVDAGLPANRLLALANDPAIKRRLLANTQQACDCGAFGAPSFLVGEELYFGKDRLGDVEEQIAIAALGATSDAG